MKYIILLVVATMLGGCTKDNNTAQKPKDTEIVLQESNLDYSDTTTDPENLDNVEGVFFGQDLAIANYLKTVKIKNNTSNPLMISSLNIENGSSDLFKVVYRDCGTIAPGKTCILKISLSIDRRNMNIQNPTHLIARNADSETLFIIPMGASSQGGTPEKVSISIKGNEIGNTETGFDNGYDLGVFNMPGPTAFINTFTVKNYGQGDLIKIEFIRLGKGFKHKIILDQCSGKTLKYSQSCLVKITFDPRSTVGGNDWWDYIETDMYNISNDNTFNPGFELKAEVNVPNALRPIQIITSLNRSENGGGNTFDFPGLDFNEFATSTWQNSVSITSNESNTMNFRSSCDANCQANVFKWLAPLTELKLVGHINVLTNTMKAPSKSSPVKITSDASASRLIIDRYDSAGRFNYVGGGSPYNLGISNALYDRFQTDVLDFRRPLNSNEEIRLMSSHDVITMFNSSNENMGTFSMIDALNLGRASETYLENGEASFSKPAKFKINMSNIDRTEATHQQIIINGLTSVDLAVKDNKYAQWLAANPMGGWWVAQGTPNVVYPYPAFHEGVYANYVGSPLQGGAKAKAEIHLKQENTTGCNSTTENPMFSVTRGDASSGGYVSTDNFCGIRRLDFNVIEDKTLYLTLTADANHGIKNFEGAVYGAPSGRIVMYIPPTSAEIDMNNGFGIGNCGTRVLNYKMASMGIWYSCPANEENVVAIDTSSANLAEKYYGGFHRAKIYDSVANKGNWTIKCAWDGGQVFVRLLNTVTNQATQFTDNNNSGPNGNLGHCGELLEAINPNFRTEFNTEVNCSLDNVLSGSNNCAGRLNLELVDPSTNNILDFIN